MDKFYKLERYLVRKNDDLTLSFKEFESILRGYFDDRFTN